MNKTKKLLALIAAMLMLAGCGATAEDNSKAEETTAATTTAAQEESKPEETTVQTLAETEPTAEEDGEIDYAEFSRTLCQELLDGNYSSLTELFSDELLAVIDENAISTAMAQIAPMTGEFKEMGDTETESEDSYTYTKTLLYYENMNLELLFSFSNGTKVIEGFSLMPAPKEIEAQDTDSYTETEIKIGEYELDGMLTMPKGVEAPPVVVLVHGSGSTDMNEDAGICKPFYDIAHDLSDQGIATVRYNKRFYQYPEMGEDEGITIDDEVLDDAAEAIKYAQSLVDEGKASKVFVLGHSLGGMVAPTIAERNSEVVGIISLAGTPRKLEDVLIEQLTAQLDQYDGEMKESIEKFIEQVDTYRKTGEIVPNDNPPSLQMMFGLDYWVTLGALEPAETADKLDIPMLFLQGDQDVQVYPDRDFPAWKEVLEDNNNCEFVMLEGLGHFFTDDTNHIDTRVTDEVARFIKE